MKRKRKKFNLFKLIFFIVVLGVFYHYENIIYRKVVGEKEIKKVEVEKNTQDISNSFLLRKEDFFKDEEYLKNLKNLGKKGEE